MPTTYHKDTVCPRCGGYFYFFGSLSVSEGDPRKYMVACQICGMMVYQGGDQQQAVNTLAAHIGKSSANGITGEKSKTEAIVGTTVLINDGQGKMVPATMSNAYQINKTREVCICCGKKTYDRPVFTGSVKYCDCVNKLPK